VTVDPGEVKVEYARSFLAEKQVISEDVTRAFSYSIKK
jgi:hypothetical protein